jgi:hypothetical protein
MGALLLKLRNASPGAIAFSSTLALVAAVVLARIDPRASFLIGMLFGLAVGLGAFALVVLSMRMQQRG